MTLIEAIQANNKKEFLEQLKILGKKIINEVDSDVEGSPLYWAAACGHADFIEQLVGAGISINKADNRGWTPVYAAAHFGNAEIIGILKLLGADVNVANDVGTTPVCAAAFAGHAKVISALKAAGADMDATEINGQTPIYIAVQNEDLAVIGALLEAKVNLSVKTSGITVLELAKQRTTEKAQEIIKILEAYLEESSKIVAENKALPVPLNIEAKAKRDVITVTGGVQGLEIALGGGNSNSNNTPVNTLNKASHSTIPIDSTAVLKQLKVFFMSNKYKGPESPDCELYTRVLAEHKGELVYDVEERVHKLFVNDEPLEPKDAIKRITQMILALQSSNAANDLRRPQVQAGRDVITILGGLNAAGAVRIGGNVNRSFTPYNELKNQNSSIHNNNHHGIQFRGIILPQGIRSSKVLTFTSFK